MGIEQDYNINNVFRQVQMAEFGTLMYGIYEKQFEQIKEAYELCEFYAYQPPERKIEALDKIHDAFYRFWRDVYEAVEKQKAEQAERMKKQDEEFERIMSRLNDPEWGKGMKDFIDSFNKGFGSNANKDNKKSDKKGNKKSSTSEG